MTTATTPERPAPGLPTGRREQLSAVELPTLLLILVTYGGWLTVTYQYRHWPFWVVAPLVIVALTLHSSLQHEILHGHPTRSRAVNKLFGMLPLSFWLPYERYRATHLVHHTDERLTDPLDDPETYYWTPTDFEHLSAMTRGIYRLQQTLAGRVVVGSFWRIAKFLHGEFRGVVDNVPGLRRDWLEHLLWCVPVILWITLVCGMPLWFYVVALVIPANGVLLIRSFAEHRARPDARHRIAVVERSWILGPLFLYNNLHSLHHLEPKVPWYELNARYRLTRERLLLDNGGLVYCTYFDVARRFLFRAHDRLPHPTGRVPASVETRGA